MDTINSIGKVGKSDDKTVLKPHSVTVENRSLISLSGVEKVVNSSDETVNLLTGRGGLCILGKGLKIQRFNIDEGTLVLEGTLDSLRYTVTKPPFIKRLFK